MSSREDPSWRLSDERKLMEDLVCVRFNFLLVFQSIVFGAAYLIDDSTHRTFILVWGGGVSTLLALTIMRAQLKFDYIFKRIRDDPDHPATAADDYAKKFRFVLPSMRRLIGYVVPSVLAGAMIFAAVLSFIFP